MDHDKGSTRDPARRGFMTTALMAVGVVVGYGLGIIHFFRYLVPLRQGKARREMFVGTLRSLQVGSSITVKDPRGQDVTVTRTAEAVDESGGGFKALSGKCPHLGCKVHWVAGEQHFYCPCHDGVFDKEGKALSGPPAKENKNLSTYAVKVNPTTGCVFVMVSAEGEYGV